MALPRLLVVDDSPAVIQTLSLTLYDHFDLQCETNPCEALLIAESFQPDAILLDLRMPEMNGEEVAERIVANPKLPHCVILFMTGEVCLHPLSHPMLQKPFGIPEVIETLYRMIEEARHARLGE